MLYYFVTCIEKDLHHTKNAFPEAALHNQFLVSGASSERFLDSALEPSTAFPLQGDSREGS